MKRPPLDPLSEEAQKRADADSAAHYARLAAMSPAELQRAYEQEAQAIETVQKLIMQGGEALYTGNALTAQQLGEHLGVIFNRLEDELTKELREILGDQKARSAGLRAYTMLQCAALSAMRHLERIAFIKAKGGLGSDIRASAACGAFVEIMQKVSSITYLARGATVDGPHDMPPAEGGKQ